MKGHNYGTCRKCGKFHNPSYTEGSKPWNPPKPRECTVCHSPLPLERLKHWAKYYGKTCSERCKETLIAQNGTFQKGHPQYYVPTRKEVIEGNERHVKAIAEEAMKFRAEGFEVMEVDKVRPDLIVRKDGRIFAVEVEMKHPSKTKSRMASKYSKYASVRVFDDIIWILREKESVS